MLTAAEKQQIENLREKGLGYGTIATSLGLTFKQVRGYFERKANIHYCLQCHIPVKQTAHRKEKKFCSDECRMNWWKQHKALIKRTPHHTQVCPYCNKTFNCYDSKRRVYCSRECYANARRKG